MVIKVRVWNGEQYISPDFIDRNGIAYWKENSIPESSSETELFTGMYYENGDEIFEGDKVRVPAGYAGDHYYKECTAVVEYDAPEFLLTDKNEKHGVVWQDFRWIYLKRIGTIHD
jgi:hypothetical protein